MDTVKVWAKIETIRNNANSNRISIGKARKLLNQIEKIYPQDIFIKTNICETCSTLYVEVWFKCGHFTI